MSTRSVAVVGHITALVVALAAWKGGEGGAGSSGPWGTSAGGCANAAGPVVALRGPQPVAFDRDKVGGGTRVDATTAQFLPPPTKHIAVHIAGGSGICWSGGEALASYPPAASWNTIHETYGMVVGVTNRADAPAFTVENFTSFAYGKGVSFDAGGDVTWTVRNLHVVYGRDDCIENDWYNSGLVDSSFLDGCYDVMSSLQDEGLTVPEGRANVVTIRNSLLRLQVMDGIYEVRELPPRHEGFWKWSVSRGPKLSLFDNVFFADDSSIGSNHADMYMAPPPGRLGECANNVMIWEGNGPFPEPLPACFKLVTGQAGLQFWDSVAALWIARHPPTLPDAAPPVVSLFRPGLMGSPVLVGQVTLIATAVDDRGVAGVQFRIDGQDIGPEVRAPTPVGKDRFTKYRLVWDSHQLANGPHSLTATARDAAGHTATAVAVAVTIRN